MTLKSTLFATLLFFSALAFASGPTITPVVEPTAICQGDSIEIAILTSDTFVTGNVFYIQLSDSSGSFTTGPIIDSVVSQGNDTTWFAMPAVSKNSARYLIRVLSSGGTIGLDSTRLMIHNTPTVNFQLPQPGYCSYAYTVPLTGGTPLGGVYSGTYVSNSAFQAYVSDTGTFEVYYTYTDSIGCFAEDSTDINITICPSPSVSVQVNPSAICAGTNIEVIIQTSNVIGSDNIFTVQLSDSTGSFTDATVLATDTSSSGNTITIPAPAEPAGNHYQVRVIASDPSTLSIPYSVSFKTNVAPPNVSLNETGSISLCTHDTLKLTVDSVPGVLYQWSFNGTPITVSHYSYIARDSGLYILNFTDTAVSGCSAGADSLFVGIYPFPAVPAVTPAGTVKLCGSGAVTLSTTLVNGVMYQWTNNGQVINGAAHSTYAADSTGIYLVEAVSAHNCISKSNAVHVNIAANPIVGFTLAFDSFCVHSAPIALSGGTPSGSGGFYSGTDVTNNSTFDQAESGVGSFKIYYTFIDSIGCSATDSANINIYNCTTSGINELSSEHTFEMFPNPANDNVVISINTGANCRMRLFNLLGQEISSQLFNQQLTYSVKMLPAGVYLVEISDTSNSWKTVKPLVVQ